MNPAYLLAKLTPKITQYQDRVNGGMPVNVLADAAGALAGLKDGPYYFALYTWTDDDQARYELERYLWDALVERGSKQAWKVKSGSEQLRKLARVIINSEINPCRCKQCAGRGEIYRYTQVKTCPRCGGGGLEAVRPSHICRVIDAKPSTWRKTWQIRHQYGINTLRRWDSQAYYHITRQG